MQRNLPLAAIIVIAVFATCKKTSTTAPPSEPTKPAPSVGTLSLESFSPTNGKAGDTVVFNGSGFGTDNQQIWIDFNGAQVRPHEISNTKLKVVVPTLAKSGKIKITKDAANVFSGNVFTITESISTVPVISSFSPTSAKVGEVIQITGKLFGTNANAVNVKFGNSASVKPNAISDTDMTVTVPTDAQTGKITVITSGGTAISAETFSKIETVPVKITSFIPNDNARTGETLIINGSGFGTDPDKLLVKFESYASVKPITANNTTLSLIVPKMPENILAVNITVQNGSQSFRAGWPISILKPNPVITDFSPKTLNELDTIKIYGQNLKPLYGQILGVNFGEANENSPLTLDGAFYISDNEVHCKVYMKDKTTVRKSPIKVLFYSNTDGTILSKSNLSKDNLTTRPLTTVYFVSSSANEYDHNNSTAKVGEIVTINGLFSVSDYPNIKVRFTGSSTDVTPEISTSTINNRFKIRVPNDAKTGTVKVSKQDWGAGITQNVLTIIK
jgi:hypothetical protein